MNCDYPKSIYSGIWNLRGFEIEAHVLNTNPEKRVITAQGAARALIGEDGRAWNLTIAVDRLINKIKDLTGAANQAKNRHKEYLTINKIKDLTGAANVIFVPPNGGYAYGYEAEDFLQIANLFVYGWMEDILRKDQIHIGRNALDIYQAVAQTGMIAIIDEVTGFQKVRAENDLAVRIEAFLLSRARDWRKLFDDELWKEYARVYSIKWHQGMRPPRGALPQIIRQDIYDYVVGEDVMDELKRRFNQDGRRPKFGDTLHQYIREHALPKILRRIGEIIATLKVSDNKEQFRYKMNRLNNKSQLQMDFVYEQ